MVSRPAARSRFYEKLVLVLISTAVVMAVFEFGLQMIFPYLSEPIIDLVTIGITSVFVVVIVYFPLRSYLDEIEKTNHEIEQRIAAEYELRKSEARFREIFVQSNDAIFIHEMSERGPGRFISVNEEACRLLGYTEAELMNIVAPELGAPGPDDNPEELSGRLFHEGRVTFETEFKTKTGEHIPVEISNRLISLEGKQAVLAVARDIRWRRNAQDALIQAKNNLDLILNSIADPVFVKDEKHRRVMVNDSYCAFTGLTREELAGKSDYDLYSRETADRIAGDDDLVFSSGKGRIIEEQIPDSHGYLHTFNTKKTLLADSPGDKFIVGIARDITERRQNDAAFKAIVKGMVGSTGPESFARITESVAGWLGADCVTVGEISPDGKSLHVFTMLLDGVQYPDFSFILKGTPCGTVVENGYTIIPDNVTEKFPGAQSLIDLGIRGYAGVPLRNHEGSLLGILCIFTRKTLVPPPSMQEILEVIAVKAAAEIERKNTEDALRESEIKFHGIFDAANDGIKLNELADDGTPGRYLDVNEAACGMVGYDCSELLGMTPFDLATGFHSKPLEEIKGDLVNSGEVSFETGHRRKDGSLVPVEVHAKTIALDGKKRVISVVRDITKRKQAENALVLSNKKLSLLASITRHDILNQLTALEGFIEFSKETITDPAILGFINRELQITARIRGQISFTKDYETLGMKAPVWQNVRLTALRATRGNLPVPIVFQGTELEIFADSLLEKVFYNICENAVRHGERVTGITITCGADPALPNASIVISDDGIGIPAGEKESIFERGYGKNTGLGLFLSREILAITGIRIRENGEPGKGGRFELTVPEGAFRPAAAS